ncbi:hypothetical protein [Streptomyces sp. NPDC093261]|uniref:hypothetical protein n=1 Tax=Streptomyces sp. NPDC093261 TaxID=3366037 RepID=UPI003830424A
MSTRGFVGFVVDGQTKITYNHHDSYPAGLGQDVLTWLWANRHSLICSLHRNETGGPVDLVRKLRVVDDDTPPTDQDIRALEPYTNLNVDGRHERPSWYQLLHGTQGDIARMLAAGAIEDSSDFPADSLFAEWGYVVDLDNQVLEIYEGFQHAPHNDGRFADMAPAREGYWPVRLVASWPLGGLPLVMPDEDGISKAEAA